MNDDDIVRHHHWSEMENGECRVPSGIIKNAQCILVVMSAKQQPLGRIFSTHSPLIRMALSETLKSPAQLWHKIHVFYMVCTYQSTDEKVLGVFWNRGSTVYKANS